MLTYHRPASTLDPNMNHSSRFADLPPGIPVRGRQQPEPSLPRVASVSISEPHWKVGDNMGKGPKDPQGFGIGQIAIVDRGNGQYDIAFYDRSGKWRGGIPVQVRSPS